MFVSALVVAAGKGTRFQSKISKPLVSLHGKPVIVCSLEVLAKHGFIKEIIVVVNADNRAGIARFIKRFGLRKVKALILGGKERQDSVKNGLGLVHAKADMVLIHDAARPFVDGKMISRCIDAARKHGAAIAGVPVTCTIKEVFSQAGERAVKQTLKRDTLWEIQTPQVFKKVLLEQAYRRWGKSPVTDDASLVEKLGKKVIVVMGSNENIKITTPKDILIAESIMKRGK